jgi:putative flippase GtrA
MLLFDFVLERFIKFGLVGISGMGVDFSTTFLLRNILKINAYVANSIGFSLAALSNYLLNRYWTFGIAHTQGIVVQGISFFLIALIGLGLNNIFLFLMHKKMNLPFYFAKLIATALVFFWNFFANTFFTF